MPRKVVTNWSQMPRNLLIHRMSRKNTNPLPIQRRRARKKLKVVHSKEYKIRWPKKGQFFKKCSLCSESFNSQLELNLHTKSVHKYRFLCSSRQCGKTFGSLETLKKQKLKAWSDEISTKFVVKIFHLHQIWLAMKPFIHSFIATLWVSALTHSVAKATKLRLNTIAIINTGISKSQQSHRKLSVHLWQNLLQSQIFKRTHEVPHGQPPIWVPLPW